MSSLVDSQARYRALTAIDESLVVEAGAGTGKTTILAGRIAVMLARGKLPEHIVAVTFTEAAASELLLRVREYVRELLEGTFPPGLSEVFNKNLSSSEKDCLQDAEKNLDFLTCSTIHGFCQRVLKTFPVEANIDPGAVVMDESQANAIFQEVTNGWLQNILSKDDGLLVAQVLIRDGMYHLQSLTDRLRAYRSATLHPPHHLHETINQFQLALKEYVDFIQDLEAPVPTAHAVAAGFSAWIKRSAITAQSPISEILDFMDLPAEYQLVTRESSQTTLTVFNRKSQSNDWKNALTGTQKSINEARKTASDAYENVRTLWNGKVRQEMAGLLLYRLVDDLKGLFQRYQQYKRSAGLLDFDDLIYGTANLLCHSEHGPHVRKALAQQYRFILVDEFQDTDGLQAEIFWNLCSDDQHDDWYQLNTRPGSIFIVGDPNQSIYRFRGANVSIYTKARETFPKENVLSITTNFRSTAPVLAFVNAQFKQPLSESHQAGYIDLQPFDTKKPDGQSVAYVEFDPQDATPAHFHEQEAETVAQVCQELIRRQYHAKDIALLTPVGTDVHHYERALQNVGIEFETQAGKSFYLLQEIQDMVALTMILANGHDTFAFGAFLRGPLVGCTDQQLLDLAWELPRDPDRPDDLPQLNAWIDVNPIKNDRIREVITHLQSLLKIAHRCTPYVLLSSAVDTFRIRAHLRLRYGKQAPRALSNIDLFLEQARSYHVRGLKHFAHSVYHRWAFKTPTPEAKPDTSQDAITISTMHNAKGLEWPVVIPINTWKKPRASDPIIVDRSTEHLYAPLFSIPVAGHQKIKEEETEQQRHERIRLWYVATTRARDLLLLTLPASSTDTGTSWRGTVNLHTEALPPFDPALLHDKESSDSTLEAQVQSHEEFMAESERIQQISNRLKWISPSRDEIPTVDVETTFLHEGDSLVDSINPSEIQGKGVIRGLVIHKLMEEVLTGETTSDQLHPRAEHLIKQIHESMDIQTLIPMDSEEICHRIQRTLELPQISPLLDSLIPECPVYNMMTDGSTKSVVAGIADAVSFSSDGIPELIIDWKSGQIESHHEQQIGAYMSATEIDRGLLVYIDLGQVKEVRRSAL
ncbi:MAG: UvrD-helicase domain-containing protein [Bacteroidetes bacterium]|nr:UvrD-helicase domain-containing protein [Bacteroidota bacterium]